METKKQPENNDRICFLVERLKNISVSRKNSLRNPEFCTDNFAVDGAVFPPSGDVSAATLEALDEDVLERLEDWLDSFDSRVRLDVFVGYAWNKETSVRKDAAWCSLRDMLVRQAKSVEDSFERKVLVAIKRLRASHGESAQAGIMRRIDEADLLLFDLAAENTKQGETDVCVNANVAYELGLAHGMKKKNVLILFPDKAKRASDLAGFLWTLYNIGENGERDIVDKPGFSACVRGILAEAAKKKLEAAEKERSSKA